MIGATLIAAMALPRATSLPAIPIAGAFAHSGSELDASARARLPRVSVTAADHDGVAAAFGGVRLADVLHEAGVPIGATAKGRAARAYVRVSASDRYSAVFSLAELDTTERRCAPLLVDARDGLALPGKTGPLRIVAPCDRTHARWVHGVTSLTVVIAPG
jgi:hypothetical protein